jgi:GH35 family endo-1,4-beta-xylanase
MKIDTHGLSMRLHKRIWWQWSMPWFWEQEKMNTRFNMFYLNTPKWLLGKP